MACSRRDLCIWVSALAASPLMAAQKASLPSEVLPYEEMTVRKHDGNEFRPLLSGNVHDGGYLEAHQTRLAPGGMPHPPNHHLHEEMFLIREGTLEVTVKGKSTRLGPGSVAFVESDDEHGVRNSGTVPTEYFVVAFGKDA